MQCAEDLNLIAFFTVLLIMDLLSILIIAVCTTINLTALL